jgi:hypothetical protein
LHVHGREDEHVVVLGGDVTVVVGDDVHRLTAGDTLALPRGVPHAHLVTSGGAQLLTIATPGGFERLFIELGVPALHLSTPPPRPDDATLIAAVRQLGVNVVGPPLSRPPAQAKLESNFHASVATAATCDICTPKLPLDSCACWEAIAITQVTVPVTSRRYHTTHECRAARLITMQSYARPGQNRPSDGSYPTGEQPKPTQTR